MITQPQREEAESVEEGASMPREDWMAPPVETEPVVRTHRFPLEWIDGRPAAKEAPAFRVRLQRRQGLHRSWRPRQLVWAIAVIAWLSGVVTGGVVVGAMMLMSKVSDQHSAMAEQMALSSGYRAMLFSPRPTVR